jgi:hypothetical protein
MSNVHSFPAQSVPEEDEKAATLAMLDNMRKLVEKDEINVVLVQACGPCWQFKEFWSGRPSFIIRQGLLGVAMKNAHAEMLETLSADRY